MSNPPSVTSLGAEAKILYKCSTGSSGSSSSISSSGSRNLNGGCTMPLNRKVKYTNSANPTTCSHLNVSQPRPSETIQMNSVRHVSMVEREVALTLRVTESPKKLNPLRRRS